MFEAHTREARAYSLEYNVGAQPRTIGFGGLEDSNDVVRLRLLRRNEANGRHGKGGDTDA